MKRAAVAIMILAAALVAAENKKIDKREARMTTDELRAFEIARNRDEVALALAEQATMKPPPQTCASYTPCKWVVFLHKTDDWLDPFFQPRTRVLPNQLYEQFLVRDQDIINKYCVCGPGTKCTLMEQVTYSGYEVYRCRP